MLYAGLCEAEGSNGLVASNGVLANLGSCELLAHELRCYPSGGSRRVRCVGGSTEEGFCLRGPVGPVGGWCVALGEHRSRVVPQVLELVRIERHRVAESPPDGCGGGRPGG